MKKGKRIWFDTLVGLIVFILFGFIGALCYLLGIVYGSWMLERIIEEDYILKKK